MPGFDTLQDTFDDGTIDPARWPQSYGDPIEVDGRAKIPCTVGYAGLRSASAYTLTGSGAFMRIYPPAANGAASAAASIFVQTASGGTDAGFLIDTAGNAVGLYLREGYADPGAVFLTYDPVAHAWIRIWETAGTLHWDTSPDGTTWTTHRTAATPAWASATDLSIVIEGHRDAGTPNYVEADNFNIAPYATLEASASLTSTSALTAAATRTARTSAALTATSGTTAAATRTARTAAALQAPSALTAAAARTTLVTAALTADTALTAAATRTTRACGTLTAHTSLTAALARRTHAAATLTATSSLTAPATTTEPADADITISAPRSRWKVSTPWT
ncbi:hypothetical protein [Streptomyces lavendofoliae]|uniref:DUF1349 domain-containing protein n=1 Tax=Streptomyces lavendofoliae TaxID=67314 RepID=A0A918I2M8_9ACTN|nr:hypothetical protein [Streptomyces lavendofoliae]GGU62738.1 hypothetical protein GCM10010274_59450 [Streptomyces lavendofoliae]